MRVGLVIFLMLLGLVFALFFLKKPLNVSGYICNQDDSLECQPCIGKVGAEFVDSLIKMNSNLEDWSMGNSIIRGRRFDAFVLPNQTKATLLFERDGYVIIRTRRQKGWPRIPSAGADDSVLDLVVPDRCFYRY